MPDTPSAAARRDLELTDREIAAAVASGTLVRVRHGGYAERSSWSAAHPEHRLIALARRTHEAARTPPVFAYSTAAAIHGLPLFDPPTLRVHTMTQPGGSVRSTAAVHRHRDRWDGSVEDVDGFIVTSLARTVFDVARVAPRATALGCADAALRRAALAHGRRTLDLDAAEHLRAQILDLVDEHAGTRGVRQARESALTASAVPESVGESVSRLHFHDLGIRDVVMQVAVRGSDGRDHRVDFRVRDVLGEYDGASKYVDRTLRGERSPAQVVLDEKRREDAIRAGTGLRLIRWATPDIRTRERFRAFLASHGIR